MKNANGTDSLLSGIFCREGHELHEGKSINIRTIVMKSPGPNFGFFAPPSTILRARFAVEFPIPNILPKTFDRLERPEQVFVFVEPFCL